ncbi:hypothetical protein FB45DRAFT_876427 [Roridomyces roridus]|uniref:Uncharacterized protein n=1 Tax=Roridomyces roridus TaxID=1738132 RepID=A0AAD7B3H8_9AGAR|nr:hypothetical protein FB45DRAFT_876427 [Roridomyces roridus]
MSFAAGDLTTSFPSKPRNAACRETLQKSLGPIPGHKQGTYVVFRCVPGLLLAAPLTAYLHHRKASPKSHGRTSYLVRRLARNAAVHMLEFQSVSLFESNAVPGQTTQNRVRWTFVLALRDKFCFDALDLRRWVPRPNTKTSTSTPPAGSQYIPAEAAIALRAECEERKLEESFFQECQRRQTKIVALTEKHVELMGWKRKFDSISVDQTNRTTVSRHAAFLGFDGNDVVKSPAAKDILAVFESDKALIFHPFAAIDHQSLKTDLIVLNYHHRSFQNPGSQVDEIQCSLCRDRVTTDLYVGTVTAMECALQLQWGANQCALSDTVL